MATITAINAPKGQSHGGLKAVMQYAVQEEKTLWYDRRLVDGVNCVPDENYIVYDEFVNTKRQFDKDQNRMYYHYVLSHPSGERVNPHRAHEMAIEFASKFFKNYECLVATHLDADHVHSHIIVNSVSFKDGLKYHAGPEEVKAMHELNDELCREYGFSVCEKIETKFSFNQSQKEYYSTRKGESWKQSLRDTIDNVMKYCVNRDEFIAMMRSEGYDVVWSSQRKNITFICPNGFKCRDNKLGDDRYVRAYLEAEFTIRDNVFRTDNYYDFPSVIETGWTDEREKLLKKLAEKPGQDDTVRQNALLLMRNLLRMFENYSRFRDPDDDEDDIDKRLRMQIRAVKNGMNLGM